MNLSDLYKNFCDMTEEEKLQHVHTVRKERAARLLQHFHPEKKPTQRKAKGKSAAGGAEKRMPKLSAEEKELIAKLGLTPSQLKNIGE